MAGIFGRGRDKRSGQGTGEAANEPRPHSAAGALVKDATTASFGADVIAESARQPVLVDFWAPWCEPCKQLAPVLEKIVKAADGKVKLVRMNIDDHPEIPGRLGVRSIPAVIAFQRGQPVDGFMGALPERDLKGFVERLAGHPDRFIPGHDPIVSEIYPRASDKVDAYSLHLQPSRSFVRKT